MCALANVLGREVCKLHELHKHGKLEEAKLLQHKLILPNTAVSKLLCYIYSSACMNFTFESPSSLNLFILIIFLTCVFVSFRSLLARCSGTVVYSQIELGFVLENATLSNGMFYFSFLFYISRWPRHSVFQDWRNPWSFSASMVDQQDLRFYPWKILK